MCECERVCECVCRGVGDTVSGKVCAFLNLVHALLLLTNPYQPSHRLGYRIIEHIFCPHIFFYEKIEINTKSRRKKMTRGNPSVARKQNLESGRQVRTPASTWELNRDCRRFRPEPCRVSHVRDVKKQHIYVQFQEKIRLTWKFVFSDILYMATTPPRGLRDLRTL